MPRIAFYLAAIACLFTGLSAHAADANRLTYLDEFLDPYYPHRDFPKLITPQWVGEEGVECVVVLAIDDMRDPAKYEAILRPILDRLKGIDGRAPVSIMTNQVDLKHEQLQKWLKEGLSIEIHTIDHPCPCLAGGDFSKSKSTYDRCVDLMNEIPGNKPVAFRMPCCDSKNTTSPRFWAEIFNKTTEKGNFLTIDSSVFNIITAKDKSLPKEITLNEKGEERFRRYVPFPSFVNTIEDYPYPYVIGRLCWQFPCVVPSDWSAQHVQKPNNPDTVRDLKLALDATVMKQGVYNLVFHPHGWIKSEQIVELIDHAVARHGKKVKFLNFRECQERLDKNLLTGQSLRNAKGEDNGVRILDLDNDGYMDVVIGGSKTKKTRLWLNTEKKWRESDFPTVVDGHIHFGVVEESGEACIVDLEGKLSEFHRNVWISEPLFRSFSVVGFTFGLPDERLQKEMFRRLGEEYGTSFKGKSFLTAGLEPLGDTWVRLRDFDGDGCCELINGLSIFQRNKKDRSWTKLSWGLPELPRLEPQFGESRPIRFLDVNNDGQADYIFSDEERYSLYLWDSIERGFAKKVLSATRRDSNKPILDNILKVFGKPDMAPKNIAIPPFVSTPMLARQNYGMWVHSGHLWWQNEDTTRLPDGVDRRSFVDLLAPPKKPVEDQSNFPTAKSPEESLASIKVRPGFKVELVASEPLIADPVAFDWGPDGRLWVVEMGDYPNGVDGKGKPGGKVKVLTDTNADGKYDKAEAFLEGIPFPTGVKVWRKGILVTAAPDIFYAEDADGDGRAEIKKTLYQGFGEGNQQHRVNGLVWGLDNWLYVGNGDSGGQIKSLVTGDVVNIGGRDLRIRPDTGRLDPQSGQTQFGRCRDDWGNWFGGNNSDPLWHYVLEDHYLRRNPHVAPPPVRVQVPQQPGAAPVFPISKTLARFNDFDRANRFTSACSPTIYRDDLFGPGFARNSFVCEPVHNLVHREILSPQGVTFTSRRADDEQQSEFLASSDSWFRPVMVRTGPDGALWIADMYRHVIEHPKWIPQEWQNKLDLRAGSDKGRIYRVYPEKSPPRAMPHLEKLGSDALVAALESSSGWERDMAQQLLIWQGGTKAVGQLERMIARGKNPRGRVHALYTLEGLGALRPIVIELVLRQDIDARVRHHAVRLAAEKLAESPELGTYVVKLADDWYTDVQMQVAYALGEWNDPRAGQALAKLALKYADDPYFSAAVMSSVNKNNLQDVFSGVLAGSDGKPPPEKLVEQLFAVGAALGDKAVIVGVLERITKLDGERIPPWQMAALAGMLEMTNRRQLSLDKLLDDAVRGRVLKMLIQARATAQDESATMSERLVAVRLIGRSDEGGDADHKVLTGLLAPQRAIELQSAAVAALGRQPGETDSGLLLTNWKSHSPMIRSQVLDVLMARDESVKSLLLAIERGEFSAQELDARRRQQLLTHKNESLRTRATKLLASAGDANRKKIVDDHQDVLKLSGDAARGKGVYAKRCANCHRLDGAGHVVGPDLAALSDKSPERLLIALLDPSRAVEDRYLDYVAVTTNGQQFTGMMASETGISITLAGPEGKQTVILRSDLEELRATGKSLMPEGLEKDVSKQELADLLAYVRSSAPPPKKFENNRPELEKAAADGSLKLAATSCKIYGPTLVFEQQYQNLGYFSSAEDHAIWTLEAPAGQYRVILDYACDNGNAGNSFSLSAGGQSLGGKIEGTGTWDNYKTKEIGSLKLPGGVSDLDLRSDGPIKGALLDLRSIRLVPVK